MSQRPSLATACKRDQRETGQIHRTPRALPLAYRRCAHMSLVHTAWLTGRDGRFQSTTAGISASRAPGRIRTCGTRFRKPLLYPLSYEG